MSKKINFFRAIRLNLLIVSVVIFILFLSICNVIMNGYGDIISLEQFNPLDILMGLVFALSWIGLHYYLSIVLVLLVCILIIYSIYRLLVRIFK